MPQLINWDSYNKFLAEMKVRDSYGSAFRILNEAEMNAEQVAQLPVPTGELAYGYKNYADGAIATWYSNYSATVENVPDVVSQINSNSGAGATNTYNWQFSANTDYSGGGSGGSTGSTFYGSDVVGSGGASNAISFLQNTVTPAVAAAGLGISLGKTIDSALYNANPDFWDNIGLSSLNPETWNGITMDMSDSGWEGVLKRGFNAIFGLNTEDKTSQMYIDENAAAYLAQYMQEQGVFATGGDITINPNQNAGQGIETASIYKKTVSFTQALRPNLPTYLATEAIEIADNGQTTHLYSYANNKPPCNVVNVPDGNRRKFLLCFAEPFDRSTAGVWYMLNGGFAGGGSFPSGGQSYTYNNKTVYYWPYTLSYNSLIPASTPTRSEASTAWLAVYGAYTESGGIDGLPTQDGATTPNFSGCTTPQDYKNALQQQFPDLYNGAITQDVAQPDGSVVRHTYVPVGTPLGTGNQTTTNPDTTGQSQSDTKTDTDAANQNLLQTLLDLLTKTYTPTNTPTKTTNPPDGGTGQTPPVVAPTGSASALWTVYNPTQAQLNQFGAWLWSSSFIDQVLKLFNNPMQSIIGVHKIFASPSISGSNNITVGYLDSGVSSNVVGAQYTTINCGTVKVREQFGNVFDYNDTDVRLYLPFIGIVPLDVMDIMRGSVNVVYHVDVITGACLAEVKVTRDGGGGTLYQFAGDAAVRYPISSGSYMGVVSGVLGVVGGIASGIMSGGATLPMAAGAIAGGMSQAKTQVQHSGSFAGNAGAMGGKKPYLIIERPQTAVTDGYSAYQGKGSNDVSTVGAIAGYFKMTDVRTDSITGASEGEIDAIRDMIESGVIA